MSRKQSNTITCPPLSARVVTAITLATELTALRDRVQSLVDRRDDLFPLSCINECLEGIDQTTSELWNFAQFHSGRPEKKGAK
jgi:hypothetical protein